MSDAGPERRPASPNDAPPPPSAEGAPKEPPMVSTPTYATPRARQDALRAGGDADWATHMRRVLVERVALLGELDAASERQAEIIASRDGQAILALLEVRQRIVDRFVAGQAELLALTETFESQVSVLDPAEAEALRAMLRTLSEGLLRVTTRDEAAQGALRQARDETRGDLMTTNLAGGARAAYRSSWTASRPGMTGEAGDTSRFADRRA